MALMHCICCDKELKEVGGGCEHQPAYAVMCNSSGNYGSTRFDPIEGGQELLFFVCDDCLVLRKERIYLVVTRRKTKIVPAAARLSN